MAKWYGKIGFAESVEAEPGVWTEEITERSYYGDLTKNTYNLNSQNVTSTNVNISNSIRIVSDPYADQNFPSMRYVEFRGTKWKIINVEVQYPGLLLMIGGLYNGE